MKVIYIALFLFGQSLIAQTPGTFEYQHFRNQQYVRIPTGNDSMSTYLLQPSGDTVYSYFRSGFERRIHQNGTEIASGPTAICGCESGHSGMWTYRHKNGNLKAFGELRCHRPIGRWTYFHGNGKIAESLNHDWPYSFLDYLDPNTDPDTQYMNNTPLLIGAYAAYHENGNLKLAGNYEIVEEFRTIDTIYTIDQETYEQIPHVVEGPAWVPISLKVGVWRSFDESGRLIESVDYDNWLQLNDKHYRRIDTRYYEFLEQISSSKK